MIADRTTSRTTKRDSRRQAPHPASWGEELRDVFRAIGGGFIFAIPLLYTMELWTIGATAELWKLLLFLGIAFLISLGLAHSREGGFKEDTDTFATIEQAVDGVAVGIVSAAVVLLVLNRIQLGDPLPAITGKVIVQAVPLSIGAAVAGTIFGHRGERNREGNSDEEPPGALHAFLTDINATAIGAIFLAFSIAPTDEVELLAAEMTHLHLVALIGLSLILSYIVVFASEYGSRQQPQPGPFQKPITETVVAYVVSLLVALVSLLLFDRIEIGDPLSQILALTLVLGLPATVGGAAGRLVI
jgi:putative integral membrane protein (TIGR02587 family)